jgi:hypothetical protein
VEAPPAASAESAAPTPDVDKPPAPASTDGDAAGPDDPAQ